jgi:hypothetical protein
MPRQSIALFCAACVLGAAAHDAPAAAEGQTLPMRYDGTRPAVEARVNGRGPFLFLIDTGAAGAPARADLSLVRRLGLEPAGRVASSDAGQAAAAIDRVTLARVELGRLARADVEAYARDYNGATYLPHIDGILGLNFFRDVLLTLDFPHSRVRIGRGALPPADGRNILDYTLVDGNPAIVVRIGGAPFQVLLDTGDNRGLDLPSEWLRRLRQAGFPRLIGSSSSVSGSAALREIALAGPLTIGRYRFDRPTVTFADEFSEANLGAAILRGFTITIDQRNRRVRLLRGRASRR